MLQTNLFVYYYCMKHELKYMAEAEKGAIVNTLSINSVCCTPEGASYGVSKYGGYGLVQTASLDYASLGIRINAVGPGPTKTPMIMHCSETHPEVISYLESTIPDGRMGEAVEQAARCGIPRALRGNELGHLGRAGGGRFQRRRLRYLGPQCRPDRADHRPR